MSDTPIPPSIAKLLAEHLPGPWKAAAGIFVSIAEDAKDLPDRLPEISQSVVSVVVRRSMQAQQQYAEWVAKGEEFLGSLREPEDDAPEWATFDEDEEDGDETPTSHVTEIDVEYEAHDDPDALDDSDPRDDSDALDDVEPVAVTTTTPTKKTTARKATPAKRATPAKKAAPAKKASSAETPAKKSAAKKATAKKAAKKTTKKAAPARKTPATGTKRARRSAVETLTGPASEQADAVASPVTPSRHPHPEAGPGPAAMPEFDTLTIPQLRARLRSLKTAELEELVEHEQAGRGRQPVLDLLSDRIETLTS